MRDKYGLKTSSVKATAQKGNQSFKYQEIIRRQEAIAAKEQRKAEREEAQRKEAENKKAPPPKPSRGPPPKTAGWDYEPGEADELALKEGDKVKVLGTVDENWSRGRNLRTGEEGLFPSAYVE